MQKKLKIEAFFIGKLFLGQKNEDAQFGEKLNIEIKI